MERQQRRRPRSNILIERTLPMEPLSWARPGQTKTGRRYDKQKKFKRQMGLLLGSLDELIAGPVELQLSFHISQPRVCDKPKGPEQVANMSPAWQKDWPENKDLDNLEKLMFDVLTGLWYVDDYQIVRTVSNKVWIWPGLGKTLITLRTLEGE